MSELSSFDVFRAAEQQPRAWALLSDEGSYSYERLAALAGRASAWLAQRGVSTGGAPVAVLARPSPAQVAMCHALWALRVPLLPLHPSLTAEERAQVLERAGVRTWVDDAWERQAPASRVGVLRTTGGDDESAMAILPTSGSSGLPRLCQLSRRAFGASARASAERLGWREEERWLLCLPFAHVGGLSVLTRCLAQRAAVQVSVAQPGVASTEHLAGAITTHRPTLVSLVPTQLVRLLDWPDFDLPDTVRVMLVGGAALAPMALASARRRGWPVAPTYGMTEACSQVATADLRGDVSGSGRPLSGVQVRIVQGQIEVRGDVMFSGYLGEAPRRPDTWFRTGDLGRLDGSGCLHVLGRVSDRIVTGGENVDPVEVEIAIASAVERRLCVAGRPHPEWGEQVAVFIEGGFDAGVLRDLVALARTRLSPFKRPRLYAFIDEFPLGPSGKIQRRALVASVQRLEALNYSADKA